MPSSPHTNPPSLLRHVVEASRVEVDQFGDPTNEPVVDSETKLATTQVTPLGLAIALTVAIGIAFTAFTVVG